MDAVMALLWLLATWLGGAGDDPECLLLGGLDAARTRAFVTEDESALRAIYADDRAAAPDLAVLRSYDDRGLRLEGMLMLRESCHVTARTSRSVTLDVVDRLGPTRVRSADGAVLELPRDRPTRRTVVLEWTGGRWRVVAVRSG